MSNGVPNVVGADAASAAESLSEAADELSVPTPGVDVDAIAQACRAILVAIGEDPDREGLAGTPDRYARWWAEFIDHEPGNYATTFEQVSTGQLVAVRGIGTWTLCEHHLLPFSCELAVGYRTSGRVLGLSKFARIVHMHAHKLQLQERLCDDVADTVAATTGAEDVIVVGRGTHLCMGMRGVRTPATMVTTSLRGVYAHDTAARAEFYELTRTHE